MLLRNIVKRTQIYLEAGQRKELDRRASAAGVTRSTLIRQAIDEFLQSPTDPDARLAQFRAAVLEVARNPLPLPDGRSYVEAIRAADLIRHEAFERRRR
jgi:hypothetical protein